RPRWPWPMPPSTGWRASWIGPDRTRPGAVSLYTRALPRPASPAPDFCARHHMGLRLTATNSTIGVIDVKGSSFTMGRHPDNDLPLRDDLASRFHCSIECNDEGKWI